MTITAFTGETISTGITVDLAAHSLTGAYIAEGATIGSTGNVAILGTDSNQSVVALGNVVSATRSRCSKPRCVRQSDRDRGARRHKRTFDW